MARLYCKFIIFKDKETGKYITCEDVYCYMKHSPVTLICPVCLFKHRKVVTDANKSY